eukprot:m.319234 g.319234  ORF g.319234 m.319234 type:complete len:290 (-) comp16445_c0_seq85:3522-4391(-)
MPSLTRSHHSHTHRGGGGGFDCPLGGGLGLQDFVVFIGSWFNWTYNSSNRFHFSIDNLIVGELKNGCGSPSSSASTATRGAQAGGAQGGNNWVLWNGALVLAVLTALGSMVSQKVIDIHLPEWVQTPPIKVCVASVYAAQLSEADLLLPLVSRDKLRDQLKPHIAKVHKTYAILIGPTGSGKSSLAVDVARNKPGVFKVLMGPGESSLHEVIVRDLCPDFAAETPSQKMVKDMLVRVSENGKREHGELWVPTIIIEIARASKNDVVSEITRDVKRLCIEPPQACVLSSS